MAALSNLAPNRLTSSSPAFYKGCPTASEGGGVAAGSVFSLVNVIRGLPEPTNPGAGKVRLGSCRENSVDGESERPKILGAEAAD